MQDERHHRVTREALDVCCMPFRACEEDCLPAVTLFVSQ